MAKNTDKVERIEKTTGLVSVLKTVRGKEVSNKVSENEISVHKFVTEPAKVQLSMGLTLNLGNYEGARIDVGITMPCYKEEAEEAYEEATKWVETRIVKELEQLRDHARKRVENSPYDR